jgi:hypothetical protein
MPKTLASIIFLLAVPICFSAPANPILPPPSREMFPDGEVHDFGKVKRGTICTHSFRIVNTTKHSIKIVSCTSMSPCHTMASKTVLGPSEVGTIVVTYSTHQIVGERAYSSYVRVFWLKTEENEIPYRLFRLYTRVNTFEK